MPDNSEILVAESITKRFLIWNQRYGPLIEGLAMGTSYAAIRRRFSAYAATHAREVTAVQDISLTLRRGDSLGIIGTNGCGKSTLLSILAGTLEPTEGRIRRRGRIQALLALGAGFNPDFSGRENVFLSGGLSGFKRVEVSQKLEQIREFADIGDFFDSPVRTYSSGMFMRLAFAASIVFEPDLLIVDEALSVGDVFFQQRCFQRILEMRKRGVALIFVSHDFSAVHTLCDTTLLMEGGREVVRGDPKLVTSRFMALKASGTAPALEEGVVDIGRRGGPSGLDQEHNVLLWATERHGSRRLELLCANIRGANRDHSMTVRVGEALWFECELQANAPVGDAQVGLNLFDRKNNELFSAGNAQLRYPLGPMQPGDRLRVRFRLSFDVSPGPYTITLIASETGGEGPNSGRFHDNCVGIGPIHVYSDSQGAPKFNGMVRLPMEFEHHEIVRAK